MCNSPSRRAKWGLLTILLVLTSQLSADLLERIDTIIPALIDVESAGQLNVIGDNGKAWGQLQIWEIVVDDVNRIYKTNYKHEVALTYYGSIEICLLYLHYWGNHYEKKTGKEASYEVLAKIWNGGPTGYKKDATVEYWKRVKPLL